MFETKFDVSIDKLEITYMWNEETRAYVESLDYLQCGEYGEIAIKRIENRNYHHQFVVLGPGDDGDDTVIGDLFFGSPNPMRPYVYLSVRNPVLYKDYMLGGISYIEQALHLEFFRISKLHLAFDSNVNIINRFYKLLKNEDVDFVINDKKIKSMDEKIHSLIHVSVGTRKNRYQDKSFYVKNNDDSLVLSAYNKALELVENSAKDYIALKVGFDKRIYRFEVRLNCYKVIRETLQAANIKDEELYCSLVDCNTLMKLFWVSLNRLIRIQKSRKSYNLLEVLI